MERHLTAVYLALCSIVIVCAMGPDRAIAALRQHVASFRAAPVRDISLERLPLAAASMAAARPSDDQGKRREPRLRQFQLAIGTVLQVQLRTALDSTSTSVNDQVDAILVDAVTQDGMELIPAGSLLHGTVVEVVAASRSNLQGRVTITFAVVQHSATESRAAIKTDRLTITAPLPEEPSGSRKRKRQPVDLVLPPGYEVGVTLADPLLVFIPAQR